MIGPGTPAGGEVRAHRPGAKLLALLLGVALAFAIAEVALRLLGPKPYTIAKIEMLDGTVLTDISEIHGFFRTEGGGPAPGPGTWVKPGVHVKACYDRPRWDYFDARGCIDYAINGLGFRDLEFPMHKPAGEFRILALGDSFTFGTGVQLEDTWVQVLETRLRETRDMPVEVVNAGIVVGHLPAHYEQWLRDGGLGYGPDVVLLGLCLNDVGPIPMADMSLYRGQSGPSAVVNAIGKFLNEARGPRQRSDTDYTALVEKDPTLWLDAQRAIAGMKALLDQNRIRFVVVVFPMLTGLRGEYPFRGLHEMVRDFCAAHDVECLDVLDDFIGRDEFALWTHPTDQHPNDVANAMIAEAVFDCLEE